MTRLVGGIQAQDLPAAALAVRARSPGITAAAVDRARLHDRSILRTWCMRGTLHLLAVEDFGWLLPLLGPIFAARSRARCLELGLTDEVLAAGIRLVQDALASRGPLTREEIAAELAAHHLPSTGQAPIHLIYRAALDGVLCQGPDRGKKPAYILVRDWVKPGSALPRESALAELARRYLKAFGPAAPEDLAAWSGLSPGEARQAWERIAAESIQVEIGTPPLGVGPAWMLKKQAPWLKELQQREPAVRLLPRFDTYLLGYASRSLAVPASHTKRVNAGGGIIHATLAVGGRVLGTWTTRKRRGDLVVEVDPFDPLDPGILPGLEGEAADVGRFLGIPASFHLRQVSQESTR